MSRPRVGFLGVGWIGLDRLKAIAATGAVEIAAFAEPSDEAAARASQVAPDARRVADLDALLALGLDGVVIATPSALHAEQAIRSLEAGAAVFCQKPLGRNAAEAEAVVQAARRADRLLGVDLSYRFAEAMREVRRAVQAGEIGRVHAVDLTFHNAYGPDKPWFRDPQLSGGGCVIDLGVHLIDLALWTIGISAVAEVHAALFAGGRPLRDRRDVVEDYATAQLVLETDVVVRLACSWNLPAGVDSRIEATFWGETGGASFRNVDGSFTDFEAELTRGSSLRLPLSGPPDAWSGRAAADWAQRLARAETFQASNAELVDVAQILDRIYAAAAEPRVTPDRRR